MQKPFPVHHSSHVCNEKIQHTDFCYFHLQLTWLDWSQSRSRSFWSRSHNRFLVSLSVSISVSHSLVSVLALVSLCSGLINKNTVHRPPELPWLRPRITITLSLFLTPHAPHTWWTQVKSDITQQVSHIQRFVQTLITFSDNSNLTLIYA